MLVTGAKVAVLVAFVAGAFTFRGPTVALDTFATRFSTDAVGIVTIAALAFITFFGFSAIAASAGEIIEPRKTVPRAIAASIVTVTVLYALVIVAMVNSPVPADVIAQEGETAMGRVAAGFLGPLGRSLIVAGAVFSMVSASNASILVIGATRTRRLRRWVFGSPPDRVIELAKGADLPVLVYASPRGVHGPIEDYVYPIYRALTGRRRGPANDTGGSTTAESRSR